MAFSQGFGKMQVNSPRMPPEIFCMAGGHTKAQSSGFCVRMAFLQGFGKGQANSRRNASRGLPAAYRGEAQKNTVSRQFRDTAF